MQYDAKGKLTRAGAVQVIKGGGTVLVAGRLYGDVDKLPSEADFAKGDEKAEAAAREVLNKQIEDAQAQLKSLEKPASEVVNPDGLDDLKIDELRQRVQEKGLTVPGANIKQNLINALRGQ